jgi:uncharacterized protein (TIGR02594 family)
MSERLKLGDRGPAVRRLQELLAGAGFSPGAVDGDFGPRTEAALATAQRALHPAGIASPATWWALEQIDRSGPPWLTIARREVGVREVPGANANPRIIEYLASCPGLPADMRSSDETPWCSAFVNWVMRESGVTGTRRANARSWLTWGQACEPQRGAVAVFSRPPDPASGHVAFFERREGERVIVLGGNQGNAVSVAAYPASRLLGYRWPARSAS